MSVKLSKVTKDLNVGLATVVEFLHKKGFSEVAENNPNARISDEQYDLLLQEFSKDKTVKKQSEIAAQRHKERPKNETVVLDSYAKKEAAAVEQPKEAPIQFKTVGKIDLDSLNKKKAAETPAEPEPQEEPVVQQEQPAISLQQEETQPEVTETETSDTPSVPQQEEQEQTVALSETPTTEQKSDEVFTYGNKNIQSSINVVGKIDLSALNQQTRPKKKTKEEKRKEREEKYPPKNGAANANANASADEKKKRNRIQKERVDINKPFEQKKNAKGGKNDRNRRSVEHTQPDEEAVQRQVRETLAMLTNKQKSKGAKYRKDKREAASQRMQEEAELERLENQTIKITEFVTVNELASMMDVPVTKVIGTCMSLGLMVSINQRLDAETINIVADEFGFKTEYVSAEVSENLQEEEDRPEDLLPRAPIVTVMGHVDHGKTSLLDYIRKANVIAGEAGGITQHIGAYNVTLENGQHITFLDTPGHEAFTAMRARGAQITDVAIIIVAADDSIMPQTVEAIHHAAAANVPIVFAINKIDKPTANPDKIKEALAGMNYLVEEWGGKYQSQDISAKKGIGINELLEKVLLEAEMLDLKANPNKNAVGSIIESSLDKGRGYLATVLVEGGTLRQGDILVSGTHFGRVKAMFNERNQRVQEVKPGEPVLLLGLNGAPQAGEKFNVMNTEQEAREIANKREQLKREQSIRTKKHLTLDELGRRIALGNFQELNVIVKGDVDGSIEALSDSLIKLSTPEIQVNVIHKAVGAISESDVLLAAASNAIIVGFQVRPSVDARRLAEKEEVDIRLYSIIYDAIEQIKDAMEGMLSPEIKEEVTATLEVLDTFKITKVGTVAGCLVREGKVKRSNKLRLIRDGIVVFTGELGSLKRMKDDVKEVATGFECGLNIANYNDVRVGDFIETFEEIEVKRTF
ncbi:MAG: translation initiation factor IF-2 [Paludibacteraceae bacterium]|jgi:translation initiation factor IF-2|nr:translation initiation factor IF-2 [Paludibacteraceae bacterium]